MEGHETYNHVGYGSVPTQKMPRQVFVAVEIPQSP